MIQKIKNSLAFRLPRVYNYVLDRLPLPNDSFVSKEQSELTLLMMAGKKHLSCLRYSLWSIAKSWSSLPRVIISTDGSLTSEQIASALSFWPYPVKVQDWKESADYHLQLNRKSVAEYAAKDPFGKKLAFIIHHSEINPVLWVDCDILFYNDFTRYLPEVGSNESNYFAVSEDWIYAYDVNVVEKFYPDIKNYKPVSTGIMLAYGTSYYNDNNLEEVIKAAIPTCMHFTEQTIFAALANKSLGVLWDTNLIKNYNEDSLSLSPSDVDTFVARHYTNNVRHLFWRDIFFHRFKK